MKKFGHVVAVCQWCLLFFCCLEVTHTKWFTTATERGIVKCITMKIKYGKWMMSDIYWIVFSHFLRPFYALFTPFLRPFLRPFYALFTPFLRPFSALLTPFLRPFYAPLFLRSFYALFTPFLRTVQARVGVTHLTLPCFGTLYGIRRDCKCSAPN